MGVACVLCPLLQAFMGTLGHEYYLRLDGVRHLAGLLGGVAERGGMADAKQHGWAQHESA